MTYIITHSGRRFDFASPDVSAVTIEDVAYSLARTPRYSGHTAGEPYSVAQHSVLAYSYAPSEHKLAALLHDAAEAFTGDLATPLKIAVGPEVVASVLQPVERTVAEALGVTWPPPDVVNAVDKRMMATEVRDLMPGADVREFTDSEPYPDPIEVWPWQEAHEAFMSAWRLSGGGVKLAFAKRARHWPPAGRPPADASSSS